MGSNSRTIAEPTGGGYHDRSSQEIKEQIETTRNRMDHTVDQLTNRIEPRAVLNTFLDLFKSEGTSTHDNGFSSVLKSTKQTVKDNPLAAAALGASALWLLAGRTDEQDASLVDPNFEYDEEAYPALHAAGSLNQDNSSLPDKKDELVDKVKEVGNGLKGKISQTGETLKDKASDIKSSVQSGGGNLKDKVSDFKGSVSDSVAEGAQTANQHAVASARRVRQKRAETADQISQKASQLAGQTKERYQNGLENNPLALLLGALGIGVVAGVVAPLTRKENQLVGDYSDSITDQMKEAGKDLVEKGKVVGERVTETILDETNNAGLPTDSVSNAVDDVKSTVKTAAENVKKEAKDAAEEEGLTKKEIEKTLS